MGRNSLRLQIQVAGLVVSLLFAGFGPGREVHGQAPAEEFIPSCPTGALLAFSKPALSNRSPVRVMIQRQNSIDLRIWEVLSRPVMLPTPGSERKFENGVGFVVPQLDQGRYIAWYGTDAVERANDSLVFDARPQLLVEKGLHRGRLLSEIDISVRISSAKRQRLGSRTPENVSARVTLDVRDAALADIISARTVSTDRNGIARWRIRIKNAGIGEMIASAEQFEPAVMSIVGMPAEGRTFREAQIAAALQQSASQLQTTVTTTILPEPRTGGDPAAIPDTVVQTANAPAAAPPAVPGQLANSTSEPRRLSELELQPGDVLLILGSSPISDGIRNFEQLRLAGAPASYSHASLYLGDFNGERRVAEMWNAGLWITPLRVSVGEARVVDVYRSTQVDRARGERLANRAANAFGNSSRFLSARSPSFFAMASLLPYAFEQISVLGLASAGAPGWVVNGTLRFADPRAGGKRKMICSEFVVWAYHDDGLELDVQPWQVLRDLDIWTSHDRQHDYTTPNMLAHSAGLTLVGRYVGP